MPKPSILLIDDHALFRSGLALLLETRLPATTVIEVGAVDEALALDVPVLDLVLLDVQLREASGLDSIAVLQQRWPQAKIVVVSAFDLEAVMCGAIQRGAVAFISKAERPERMLERVQLLLCGGTLEITAIPADPVPLTPRQIMVLELMCQGLTNKQIARRLKRSENTVRCHVQTVLATLNVSCRTEAAYAARRRGLIL